MVYGSKVMKALAFAAVLAIGCNSTLADDQKRVAITIDDAPSDSGPIFTTTERAEEIVSALDVKNAPSIGVFALGKNVQNNGVEALILYGEAGHMIGNHSHNHLDASLVTPELLIDDIMRADGYLSRLPGFEAYFRFPYLRKGETSSKADEIFFLLSVIGYEFAPVTIDTFDFVFERQLEYLIEEEEQDEAAIMAFGSFYTEVILKWMNFYHELSEQHGDVPSSHILLLHENDVTALFLSILIDAARRDGWEIVSVHDALKARGRHLDLRSFPADQSITALTARSVGIEVDRHPLENVGRLNEKYCATLFPGSIDECMHALSR